MSRATSIRQNPSSSHHLHFSWQKLRVTVCRRIRSTRRRYYRSLFPVSELPGAFDFFLPSLQNGRRRGRASSRWQFAEDFPWGGFIRALTWTLGAFGSVFVTDPSHTLNALRDVCTRGIHCGPLRWFSVYANTSVWKTLEGKYSTWYHTVL